MVLPGDEVWLVKEDNFEPKIKVVPAYEHSSQDEVSRQDVDMFWTRDGAAGRRVVRREKETAFDPKNNGVEVVRFLDDHLFSPQRHPEPIKSRHPV